MHRRITLTTRRALAGPVATALLASLLGACGGGDARIGGPGSDQPELASPRIEVAVPALQGEASSKPAPPPFQTSVLVEYRSTSVATVGQTFDVVLDFSRVTSRGAKVTISGDSRLVLTGAKPITLKEGETSVTFQATAVAAGRSLIYVFTRQGTGGSAIAIPIEISPA